MPTYSFPQSVRKYIRLQKADIRRQILDMAEQKARTSKLYEDMIQRYQVKDLESKENASLGVSPKPKESITSK